MTIRPKTKRRILSLVVGLLAVAILGTWFVTYRLRVADRLIDDEKVEGMAAYHAGDYPKAIELLNVVVTRHKEDADALYAFGVSRSKVPTVDGKHIVEAIGVIRKYCSLRPDDLDAQHLLLELEAPVTAYASAAIATANDILRDHPDDLVALKAIVQVHQRERKFDDALDAATKYATLNPTDLEMQQRFLSLMQGTNKTPAEIHAHADDLAKKYPDDPRFMIVQAWAYFFARQAADSRDQIQSAETAARTLLLTAAQKDPPDVQFVTVTSASLERMGEYGVSQDLLSRALAKMNDPILLEALVQRLWQTYKYTDVVARLKDFDAKAPGADVRTIAYEAMSLRSLGKTGESEDLVAILEARGKSDVVASSWATALRCAAQANADPKDDIAKYQDAVTADPVNPFAQYMLGETYSRMNETDLALRAWRSAAEDAPSWPAPHVHIAEALTRQGHGTDPEALIAADQAWNTSAESGKVGTAAMIARAMVRFSRLQQTHDAAEAKDLLAFVGQIQQQIAGEPNTLPIYCALLEEDGQRDAAVAAIRDAINTRSTLAQDREQLLLQLAQVSRIGQLGLEEFVYAAAQKEFGMTPRLAAAEAADLLAAGHKDDGLKLLQDAKAKSTGDSTPWEQAICQYLEKAADPGAAAAWEALADAHPNDLAIQSTILTEVDSAWHDRPFIDRTIDRLRVLTGDDAITWKMARARWLEESDDKQRDSTAAIVLLTDVIKSSPSDAYPHALLARAYENVKNLPAAISEWRLADNLNPGNAQLLYSLFRALHASGNTADAGGVFDRLAEMDLSPDLALRCAMIIAAEGDLQRAETMLLKYPNTTMPLLRDSTLAKVYHMEGRVTDAATLYFKLAPRTDLPMETILDAADFFGGQHDLPQAHKFLDRLSGLDLPPGKRELLLASFEENYGDPAAAAKFYDAAVVAAGGTDPAAAIQHIGYLMRMNRWDDAKSDTDAAMARWPDNAMLSNLNAAQATLAQSPDLRSYRSIVQALAFDPSSSAPVDTLVVLSTSGGVDPAVTLEKLNTLIDKYPNFLPLYEVTVQRLLALRRVDEAINLANGAMTRFRQSPDAAGLAAQTYKSVGQWKDVVLAAREWRQRAGDHPLMADLMISTADLHLDQSEDAVARLAPYVPAALQNPDANRGVILGYAEALIRGGQIDAAAALLHPLAEKSRNWRIVWLKMASFSFTDGPSAADWIERIRPLLDALSIDDQREVATAYSEVAFDHDYPKGYTSACDALRSFIDGPKADVPSLVTFALAAKNAHQNADAEHAYRRAMEIQPGDPNILSSLASLLLQKSDPVSLKDAMDFANQAVVAAPKTSDSSAYYNILARVQMKVGHYDDAVTTFELGVNLNPKDLSILVGLADAYANTGQRDQAAVYLQRANEIIPGIDRVDPALRDEMAATRELVHKAEASNQ